jgi:hypothetical protein
VLERLPGEVVAPRCYGTREDEDSGWIWMERVVESAERRWTTDQYVFAAHQLGRFSGTYASGAPLPDFSWLCKEHIRHKLDDLHIDDAWDHPFVNKYFTPALLTQARQVWDERERFYAALAHLPQVFSHFDFHRRNLMLRQQAGEIQLVALDWAWCGHSGLGGDLFSLVGGSAQLLETDPTEFPELEAAAFEAYLKGLREAGWTGSPEIARLGYLLWTVLLLGVGLPAMTMLISSDAAIPFVQQQFGCSREQLASNWAKLSEFALAHADEVRQHVYMTSTRDVKS